MRAARLYDTPEEFAVMIKGHLDNERGMRATLREDEPLLLDVCLSDDPKDIAQVSLHNSYRTYMAGGDLNTVIDQLNGILNVSNLIREKGGEELQKLDAAYIYPAIRDERYVMEAGRNNPFISDAYLPGLRVIFIEIKDSFSKIVTELSLESNPRLTAERVKRIAYRNLRSAGWIYPKLELTSPCRKSCTIDAYTDNPHPIECQFLLQPMAAANLPDHCVIAYTNRKYALLLRSAEPMDTAEQVVRLVEKSRFKEVVKRSFRLLPNPVSMRMYWIRNGQAEWLDQLGG
ncbi:hypothetical protein [Cohnella panacarvi]|uniref:hypothetical protein n=1 Tax=Cohnella panacarvi TaxID=400776 RepID=UPI0004796F05|nr:hypothetical protein [Cohnella panacarvi]